MGRPIQVTADDKVRERRARRWGQRRGWSLEKLRGCGARPWRVSGGPKALSRQPLSIDELEQALGIGR